MRIASLAVAFAAALVLSGCGLLEGSPLSLLDKARESGGKVADETAAKAAQAIDAYCRHTPADVRARLRDAVNSRTEQGDIEVTCVGD